MYIIIRNTNNNYHLLEFFIYNSMIVINMIIYSNKFINKYLNSMQILSN